MYIKNCRTSDNYFIRPTLSTDVKITPLKEIVTTLFPHHENSRRQTVVQLNECVIPLFKEEERRKICGRIGDNKAPGLDSIHNRTLKMAMRTSSDLLANTFEAYLKQRIFPAQ